MVICWMGAQVARLPMHMQQDRRLTRKVRQIERALEAKREQAGAEWKT